jgi:hypothetical protein
MTGKIQRTESQPEALPIALSSAAAGGASSAPSLIPCPACGLPAEITERFTLASTNGPVDHIAMACVVGHLFRMAVDRLPADAQVLVRAGHTSDW